MGMNLNRFLRFAKPPIPPDSGDPPKRIYALLDQIETLGDGNIVLLFDSVDANWFDDNGIDRFSQNPPTALPQQYFEDARAYVLEWNINLQTIPPVLSLLNPNHPSSENDERWFLPLEQIWVEFQLAQSMTASSDVQIYYNLFADPLPVSVTASVTLSDSLSLALKQSDPLAPIPDSSISTISSKIRAALANQRVDHLSVYDVGQGNCGGLSVGGCTAIYVDFGGGVLANRNTFPLALNKFCFCPTQYPPIILSHWDWDHWSSANRDTRAFTSSWIVPRQKPLGHVHGTFIAAVQGAGGNFLVWPKASGPCRVSQVTVDQCTGTRRNDSGLALNVAAPTGITGDPILLPGDATYNYLPAITAPFDTICCPHHGGNLRGAAAPACPANIHSRLAYSFGSANTYKHPFKATRIEHDNKGWYDPAVSSHPNPLVRETANRNVQSGLGHIAVGWTNWNRSPAILCNSKSCNLKAQQT